MIHDFAPRLAALLTSHTVPVQPGDFVVIQTTTEALPMITALSAAVLARGGIPHTAVQLPLWDEHFLTHATDAQIDFLNPLSVAIYEQADILYNIDAPLHVSPLASVPAARLTRAAETYSHIQNIFFRRLGDASLRWNHCAYPTLARAQQAEMSYYTFQQYMFQAYALHMDDPAQFWIEMGERQTRITDWLMTRKEITVRGPGIDLSFRCEGRNWYSAHGVGNLPDGEILTCPLEESVNGVVEFNTPAYRQSKRVVGARLVFKDGVVVEASAHENEDYLLAQLDTDAGARRLGEFAIGTNRFVQKVVGWVLMDEKVGGTIHMALGSSAAPAEGKNLSKIHWDIVHDMRGGGELYADGELFYRAGEFLVS